MVLSSRGSGETAARYSGEAFDFLDSFARGMIFLGAGRTPFMRMGKGCFGWTRRGTSMNLGDSGGI